MGLTVTWKRGPIPRRSTSELICDVCSMSTACFSIGSHLANYMAAMDAGWLEQGDAKRDGCSYARIARSSRRARHLKFLEKFTGPGRQPMPTSCGPIRCSATA
jgi:hypothetical protein